MSVVVAPSCNAIAMTKSLAVANSKVPVVVSLTVNGEPTATAPPPVPSTLARHLPCVTTLTD